MTKEDILCNLVYDIEKIEYEYLLKVERIFLSSALYLYIVSLNKFDIIYYNNDLKFHGIPVSIKYEKDYYYYYSISIKEFSISEKELKE